MMQIAIRILAIVAAGLAMISLVLILVSIPFQEGLHEVLLGPIPDSVVSCLPVFPAVPFVSCFFSMVFSALLIICCGNRRGGIWLEVVLIVHLAVLLPIAEYVANIMLQPIYNSLGTNRMVAYVCANSLSNQLSAFAHCGRVLSYLVAGMSIAFKSMCKKENRFQ